MCAVRMAMHVACVSYTCLMSTLYMFRHGLCVCLSHALYVPNTCLMYVLYMATPVYAWHMHGLRMLMHVVYVSCVSLMMVCVCLCMM